MLQKLWKKEFYSQFKVTCVSVATGGVCLVFEAWQVNLAAASSRESFENRKVFVTVFSLELSSSYVSSYTLPSFHQITDGAGEPENDYIGNYKSL